MNKGFGVGSVDETGSVANEVSAAFDVEPPNENAAFSGTVVFASLESSRLLLAFDSGTLSSATLAGAGASEKEKIGFVVSSVFLSPPAALPKENVGFPVEAAAVVELEPNEKPDDFFSSDFSVVVGVDPNVKVGAGDFEVSSLEALLLPKEKPPPSLFELDVEDAAVLPKVNPLEVELAAFLESVDASAGAPPNTNPPTDGVAAGAGDGAAPNVKALDALLSLAEADPPNENPPDPMAPAAGAGAFEVLDSDLFVPGRGVSQAPHFDWASGVYEEQVSHFHLPA